MQITRATDYAVRVTVHLASLSGADNAPLGELAGDAGVRGNCLSKILQRLVRKGIVSSHRGTGGGFRLSVPADQLTLLQVVDAIEGPIELNVCLGRWQPCPSRSQCVVYAIWQRAQSAMSALLSSVTIAELAAESVSGTHTLPAGTHIVDSSFRAR